MSPQWQLWDINKFTFNRMGSSQLARYVRNSEHTILNPKNLIYSDKPRFISSSSRKSRILYYLHPILYYFYIVWSYPSSFHYSCINLNNINSSLLATSCISLTHIYSSLPTSLMKTFNLAWTTGNKPNPTSLKSFNLLFHHWVQLLNHIVLSLNLITRSYLFLEVPSLSIEL